MREIFAGLDGLATMVAISSGVPITLFILFYAKRSDWKSTDAGKALMYQSVAMLTILIIVVTSVVFPEYEGRAVIRLVGYTFLVATLWKTFAVLLRYQNSWEAQKHKDQMAQDLIERTRWHQERDEWLNTHDGNGKRIDPDIVIKDPPLKD